MNIASSALPKITSPLTPLLFEPPPPPDVRPNDYVCLFTDSLSSRQPILKWTRVGELNKIGRPVPTSSHISNHPCQGTTRRCLSFDPSTLTFSLFNACYFRRRDDMSDAATAIVKEDITRSKGYNLAFDYRRLEAKLSSTSDALTGSDNDLRRHELSPTGGTKP